MDTELSITPRLHEGYRVLVLEGELDMENAASLDEALDACTDGLPVIVELSGLGFVESTGLHVLFKQRDGGRPSAIVRAPVSSIARVLSIVEAQKVIPLYDDLAAAVEGVTPPFRLTHDRS